MFGFKVRQPPPVDVFYDMTPMSLRRLRGPGASHARALSRRRVPADRRSGQKATDLFVGDTLFAGSIGRTDLPGGDYEVLMRSITKVLFPLGDEAVVHPGHGPDTTIGRERTTNPFVLEYLAATLVRLPAVATSSTRPTFSRSPDARRAVSHSLAVDVRAVGAFEVAHFELAARQRRQPAMHARDERGVDDEIGAGRAADGADGAGENSECTFRKVFGDRPQDPHACGVSYRVGSASDDRDRESVCNQQAGGALDLARRDGRKYSSSGGE